MYWKVATSEQEEKIYAEFNTNGESAKKDVQHLMQWMTMQPHLPHVQGTLFAIYTHMPNTFVSLKLSGNGNFR